MVAECLSVCTRTHTVDYVYKGTCEENFYQVLRDKQEWNGLTRLIETTLPAVLLLKNNLFVTAIPTGRKDKVGTPIRWNFLLQTESAGKWFEPLVAAFKNGQIKELGDKLDVLCGIAGENREFHAPDIAAFTSCLPAPGASPDKDCILWTSFCPTEEAKLQEFIDGLNPPGEVVIYENGKELRFHKKKASSRSSLIKWVAAAIAAAVMAATGVYMLSSNVEEKAPNLEEESPAQLAPPSKKKLETSSTISKHPEPLRGLPEQTNPHSPKPENQQMIPAYPENTPEMPTVNALDKPVLETTPQTKIILPENSSQMEKDYKTQQKNSSRSAKPMKKSELPAANGLNKPVPETTP